MEEIRINVNKQMALLGVDNQNDLRKKVKGILFVDTQTGKVLNTIAA